MGSKYELVLVINTEKYQGVLESVDKLLKLNKARVEGRDEWGVKPLAYAIDGQKSANYVIFDIDINSAVAGKLQQQLNIEEGVIRYLMTTPERKEVEETDDK
ncbi:MAG TPA: 30S ribosomal protein S6 [Candidatus Saccharibacteria bacterium]|jgi:ribosomal protein S6|nr:30S ribosomal protein S6 [Candidatus Saccharibacteria bacterium]